MHLAPLIRDLAIILAIASVVAFIFQRIRQPVVLGYIVAGMIVGPSLRLVSDLPSIRTWADLGVIFLMFTLGLEFSFRKLSKVGISAGLTAVFETSCMMLLGFATGRFLLHWAYRDSIFLGAMLSISSTVIILKALEEMGLKTRRFSEMIFAVLIVEDLIAILILVVLSTLGATRGFSGLDFLVSILQLILVIGGWFLAGYFIVPRFIRWVGATGSSEVLTLIALGLCLSLVVFAAYFGYSVALGAFVMGSILAESTESSRIIERMEPLRDVFAAIFFVSVGMLIDPKAAIENWPTILLITGILILAKVIFVTIGAVLTGQTLRTSIQVGFGLGQIGEFSFIIVGLGHSLGITNPRLYPIAVTVSLFTAFTTPYMIRVSHRFAVWLEKMLPIQVRDGLSRYAAWTQERRANRAHTKEFYQLLFRWLLNGLIVSIAFVLTAEIVLPRLSAEPWSRAIVFSVSWMIGVVFSAPFIWAMFHVFRDFKLHTIPNLDPNQESQLPSAPPRGGTLLISRIATVIWIGLLSLEFFPARYALAFISAINALLFVAFYPQLEGSYRWFENRFLSAFAPTPKTKPVPDVLRDLTPWDAHLVRIKVHPNAPLVGNTLADTQMRKRYGVSVVAIQRGVQTLVAPKPDQIIFPKDELLVLGTDDQIDTLRPIIERPPGLADRFAGARAIEGYQLKNLFISERSPLLNCTLREAAIREDFGALVVGVERNHRRIINPDSNMKLQPGDIVWIVGEREKLDVLTKSLEP
ncbi:MAG: cation:proton antiporter [Bdellovibrionia bacterium]